MRILAASAAALAAFAFAAPASADPPRHSEYRQDHYDGGRHADWRRSGDRDYARRPGRYQSWNFEERLDRLEWRLREGARHGDLNRREARRLYSDLRDIREQRDHFRRSGRGISRREASRLDDRLDRFRRVLRTALNDDNRHGYRYGQYW